MSPQRKFLEPHHIDTTKQIIKYLLKMSKFNESTESIGIHYDHRQFIYTFNLQGFIYCRIKSHL